MLRGPAGKGWWMRNDSAAVGFEPSIQYVAGMARRSMQIVLSGVTPAVGQGARVRWKLARVKAADPARPAAEESPS